MLNATRDRRLALNPSSFDDEDQPSEVTHAIDLERQIIDVCLGGTPSPAPPGASKRRASSSFDGPVDECDETDAPETYADTYEEF